MNLSKRISELENRLAPKTHLPVAFIFSDCCYLKGKRFNSESELNKQAGTCFKIYADKPKGEKPVEL